MERTTKPRFYVAHYATPGEGDPRSSVAEEPIAPHGFIVARFDDSRYGVVEITGRDNRLEIRAPEGVIEIAPGGSNVVYVQVLTPFGDRYGSFRAYEKGK